MTQIYATAQSTNTQSSSIEYLYADNQTNPTAYPFLNGSLLDSMDSRNYELPIIQVSKLNGIPVIR